MLNPEVSFLLGGSKAKKLNVTVAATATFFPDFGATTFFFLFLPKFWESTWEFPEFFGNSQKFSGIPRNSCEFPYFQKKIKKKN